MAQRERAEDTPGTGADDGRASFEAAEDGQCRALVPVQRARRPIDVGQRFLAAIGYFAWLGYVTAPFPLLLLNLPDFRRRPALAYHALNATAWSLFVLALRVLLIGAGIWASACSGKQTVCSALNLVHLVLILAFATLLSLLFAIEAMLGRRVSIPLLSRWARARLCAQAADLPQPPG
ncbi:MAG: hypothetical protein AB7Y46_13040 [Armatimonadota bacterium]